MVSDSRKLELVAKLMSAGIVDTDQLEPIIPKPVSVSKKARSK